MQNAVIPNSEIYLYVDWDKNKNIPFYVLPYLWLKFLAWLGHCSLNYVLHLYKTYRWLKICYNPWGKEWRNSRETLSHNEGNWKSIAILQMRSLGVLLMHKSDFRFSDLLSPTLFFSDCPGFTCFGNTVLSYPKSHVLILQATPQIWVTAEK